ncbi:Uncharacterised protein [Vibrio cholerae]|nr:Uncharacterised protein [Vibrio cholerae]CSI32948.1 Uncharacterised protein [Vibrio cholerae]
MNQFELLAPIHHPVFLLHAQQNRYQAHCSVLGIV